jgi:4-aminobutyrate aminotransferase-like enzyme/Ser/Thr protein kinase RdoA (MazF antagonist)
MNNTGSAEITHWTAILAETHGISAGLEPLDGEYDLNFRIVTDGRPSHVLKVMRPGCDPGLVDLQCAALAHLARTAPGVPLPRVVPALGGALSVTRDGVDGQPRVVWLVTLLDGVAYGDFRPQGRALLGELGGMIGRLDAGLADFAHPALARSFKWNLIEAGWVTPHLGLIDGEHRRIVERIRDDFEARLRPALAGLPPVPIHNDINDYNILVALDADRLPRISGLIDFGDMVATPAICELAIAGAYAVLDQEKPLEALAALVAGYHAAHPLSGEELTLIWPLLLTRLAVSVVNAAMMKRERPDDPYVVISEAPAWRFLEASGGIAPEMVLAQLRLACGGAALPAAPRILGWLTARCGTFAPVLDEDLGNAPMADLSVGGGPVPRDPFALTPAEAAVLGGVVAGDEPARLGAYAEPRLIYTGAAFRSGPYGASDRRTVHLGVDIFAPTGRRVLAPLAGTVEAVADRADRFDYGGVVILRHATEDGDAFFTLYGHLNPDVVDRLAPGQNIAAGQAFATLGAPHQNGGWAPHLHFQLALTTSGFGHDWPGVANPDEVGLWTAICPNPAALLNLADEATRHKGPDFEAVRAARGNRFAANLKLSYREPCMFLRGWKHYLFDQMGRPYLDAYNNVPHVGHAHPRIQALAARQMAMLNTNTRYLHPAQIAFAETLTAKLPEMLSVCFFVNSGSEGNELALRLARAHTQGRDMVVPDHGYHGMTTGALDLSAYKFNGPGGKGAADWVHLIEVADPYRGRYRGDPEAGAKYAAEVDGALGRIAARGGKLAGFIAETFPSVGGQIIPPRGYLPAVYEKIRAAGGVCIADEVQTGLGRLGRHYWGFEAQGAEPDIVVLGKPLGNGHPLGAVVTTAEIAASFANGMEFFSTFGGSTLSCMVGCEVLTIIDEEGLQANAGAVGDEMLAGLRALQQRHPIIGDVRGMGLFLGVELVRDRETLEPATEAASTIANRLRDHRILIGTEGPHDSVLKIRPPLTFGHGDAAMLLDRLDRILGEDACRAG